MKRILTALLLVISSQAALAAGLVNDMQSCQGLLEFIDKKLDTSSARYSRSDIKEVRQGLTAYDDYIQREIIAPSLLEFNGGDKGKANDMQKQVDAYKATLVGQYDARYPDNQLYMDHAIAVNECAKKAVPAGDELEALKTGLTKMVEMVSAK